MLVLVPNSPTKMAISFFFSGRPGKLNGNLFCIYMHVACPLQLAVCSVLGLLAKLGLPAMYYITIVEFVTVDSSRPLTVTLTPYSEKYISINTDICTN